MPFSVNIIFHLAARFIVIVKRNRKKRRWVNAEKLLETQFCWSKRPDIFATLLISVTVVEFLYVCFNLLWMSRTLTQSLALGRRNVHENARSIPPCVRLAAKNYTSILLKICHDPRHFRYPETSFFFLFSCATVHLYKLPFWIWPTSISTINEPIYCRNDGIDSSLELFREGKECYPVLDGIMLEKISQTAYQCWPLKSFVSVTKCGRPYAERSTPSTILEQFCFGFLSVISFSNWYDRRFFETMLICARLCQKDVWGIILFSRT